MSVIAMIIIGGLVGWAAAEFMGRHEGIIASVVIGVVGSFIGSIVSAFVTGSDNSYLALSWVGVFWSFVGSLILLAIVNTISRPTHHTTV